MTPTVPSRQPRLYRNRISFFGAVLALVSVANIFFLLMADALAPRPNPYIGIFAYVVLPGIVLLSLLLVPIGMLVERRRRRRLAPGEIPALPRIDLNAPGQRWALGFMIAFTVVYFIVTSVGSYQAYRFSDSVTFCGELCHQPMKPQFTAYQASPHARVPCVECHVGKGATWYVRAKLTGLYQVYAVAADVYPRPIGSPIKSLRPAQDTCEECHWPEKFWGEQLKTITHFASDEKNTRRQIRMLVKTGGGNPAVGLAGGIHWHMNIQNEVLYIAKDPQRQEILWARSRDAQGRVTEYMAKDANLTPEDVAKADKRQMDCMDCHNRPSHVFEPPDQAVNQSIAAGRIDRSLPFVKRQAVETLTQSYPSLEAAREGIASALDRFYLTRYAATYPQKRPAVQAAIAEVQRLYETNVFPEMKTDWQTHPNNIGHLYYSGCFRCHNGDHVSAEGTTIRKACEICHTIVEQTEDGKRIAMAKGEAFRHPVDIGDIAEAQCSSCHTGGVGP